MKVVLVLFAALLCSGCFVVDEIEKGRAIMDAHSPESEHDSEKKSAASSSGAGVSGARQRLAEYYAKQRAKAAAPSRTTDPGDVAGRCRIRGSVQFLRRSDCKLRGGTFL